MSDRDLPNEQEHKVLREEVEQSDGGVHERHIVREEVFQPAGQERDVARQEPLQPAGVMRDSGLHREEVLSAQEDRWRYASKVLHTLGLWIGVILAVTEALLVFRLWFLMAGANQGAGFVSFIYGSTGWMVAPFQGITPNTQIPGGGFFEPATLIGILAYPVLALLIVLLLRAIAAWPRPEDYYSRRASRRHIY